MIDSMTGYARGSNQGDWGEIVWECRCVNHRYLELSVKTPEIIRSLEPKIREKIKAVLSRGKVECTAKFIPGPLTSMQFTVNEALLNALVSTENNIVQRLEQEKRASAYEWMRWPEVMLPKVNDCSEYFEQMLVGLDTCLENLKQARSSEGAGLGKIIQDKLEEVRQSAQEIRPMVPQAINAMKEKIREKLLELKAEGDPTRLEQEMLILSQKMDIEEELDRIMIHCSAVELALKQGSPAGRRLDFLMQELNREANTLSSKSTDVVISKKAVDLKVLIEQMREQVQNVE